MIKFGFVCIFFDDVDDDIVRVYLQQQHQLLHLPWVELGQLDMVQYLYKITNFNLTKKLLTIKKPLIEKKNDWLNKKPLTGRKTLKWTENLELNKNL